MEGQLNTPDSRPFSWVFWALSFALFILPIHMHVHIDVDGWVDEGMDGWMDEYPKIFMQPQFFESIYNF